MIAADPETDPIAGLLRRMREGDRAAAAEFLMRYGTRLRRRVRGKLSPAMRRIYDSQEILSTVGRRLDQYVHDRRLDAGSEAQLWALVFRMAENALIDKARIFRRLQEVEGEDSAFAHDLLGRLRRVERGQPDGLEVEIEKALRLFRDSIDRQILSLWLVGHQLQEIALLVDLSAPAVRQRWRGIRTSLQERFAA